MNGLSGHELWRITPQGLRRLLEPIFGETHIQVEGFGNSKVASGEYRGLVAQEFRQTELDDHDPRFTIETCGIAIKPMT